MSDTGVSAVFLGLMLLLPLSSLIARRVPIGSVAKMALAWIAIFGVLMLAVANWGRVAPMVRTAGDALGLSDQSVSGETVRIRMAEDGHFWATGTINGAERRMLVDSGATTTAISAGTAQAAGLDLNENSFPTTLSTANGQITAQRSTVRQLDIGGIHAKDLPVVVSAAFGDTDVVGMNFLSRLKSWRVEGNVLVLEPRGAAPAPEARDP